MFYGSNNFQKHVCDTTFQKHVCDTTFQKHVCDTTFQKHVCDTTFQKHVCDTIAPSYIQGSSFARPGKFYFDPSDPSMSTIKGMSIAAPIYPLLSESNPKKYYNLVANSVLGHPYPIIEAFSEKYKYDKNTKQILLLMILLIVSLMYFI